MRKNFLFVATLSCCSIATQAQTNAWADYFILADSSHAFFVAPSASALSAYSAPGGGRLLREAASKGEKMVESWAFEKAARPAFLMIRSEAQGAKVFPLETPVFELQHIRKQEKGQIPVFEYLAARRPGVEVKAELWVQKEGQWKNLSTQTLPDAPAVVRFEEKSLSDAGEAQVRFSANGVLLHTEILLNKQSAAAGAIEVFPNPAAAFFMVTAATEGRFTLSDLTGKVLFSGNLKEGQNEIRPSGLPAGTYGLLFTPANGSPQAIVRIQLLP